MTDAKLLLLLALLKTYRAVFTWSTKRDPSGHDVFRERADAVIRDVRRLLDERRFYRIPAMTVRNADLPRLREVCD